MSQFSLFGEAPQTEAIARTSPPRPKPQKRSKRPPAQHTKQISLSQAIAPALLSPIEPALEVLPVEAIAPVAAKELPAGWVDASDPAFNFLKNCRLCGAPIKHGGLDHSLCSGDCGWVIDLQWEAWMKAHKRKKEPEPQAATHTTEDNDFATLDLFSYGLEGGEA